MKGLYLLLLLSTSEAKNPSVTTPHGDFFGSILTTRLNKTIYSFRGIRYAKPPIGDLRFKPSVPIKNWTKYDATADGPACPQPALEVTSEDCLFLNVYTTKLPDRDVSPNRSVIIFIHPGAFYTGTGRSNWLGPQYFLDQDIVLVTINYRLASLGLLSIGKEVPGNNAFKDQVVAFKWVRDYIKYFGGNSDSVTLFGYAAGSFSVSLHLVSPMSRGLFHKAILSSGSVTGQIPLSHNQLELAKKQARFLLCPEKFGQKLMLACLKKVPSLFYVTSTINFFGFNFDPTLVWFFVIEEDYGQERFISEDPVKMIERGDFAKVPIVLGVTTEEVGHKALAVVNNSILLYKFNKNYESQAPISFMYERNTARSKEISASIKKFYFNDKPVSNASVDGLTDAYADSVVEFAVNRLANLISEKNPGQVYYYRFSYPGRYSFYIDPKARKPWAVVHMDDLIYLFYISILFPYFDQSYPETEMVEKLTVLWATFAQTGKPIPPSSQLFQGITWEPYNVSTKKYLDIGKEIKLQEKLYQDRYDFWNELFPLPSQNRTK